MSNKRPREEGDEKESRGSSPKRPRVAYIKTDANMEPMIRKWSLDDVKEVNRLLNTWETEDLADDRYVLFFMDVMIEASKRRYEISHVDPIVLVVMANRDADSNPRNIEVMRRALAPANPGYQGPIKIILIPIVYSGHWSLLVYIHSVARWFHYDSYVEFPHRRYAKGLLARCIDEKLLVADKSQIWAQLDDTPTISRQLHAWECSNYVLMYIYYLILPDSSYSPLSTSTHSVLCNHGAMYKVFQPLFRRFIEISRAHIQ